jgi:O6-methylguanine-DNA--protein-cysteine methyltransferase
MCVYSTSNGHIIYHLFLNLFSTVQSVSKLGYGLDNRGIGGRFPGRARDFSLLPEFLAADPEVPGSIPGTARLSEQHWVWNEVESVSRGQLRSYMEEIIAAPV